MIGIANHVGRADSSMRDGKWIKKELKRTELYRKTLGILGLGRIGTELAKRGEAFGMTVVAYDPFVEESDYADMKTEMKDVLNISDYVSLHLPLVDSTRGIINSETLKEFKDGSFLINTGRGKTIVEEDVADALQSGKLLGFGNDVWYSDPPESNPFADFPNVLMMPHLGASTKENLLRIGVIIENIINEYINN
jgi:D-3-phosphoglycerate dehydrogenase